jgi:hypothetical protein
MDQRDKGVALGFAWWAALAMVTLIFVIYAGALVVAPSMFVIRWALRGLGWL